MAVLTPPGRAAVSTVLVSGPAATAVVDDWFRAAASRPLDSIPARRIACGRWNAHTGGGAEEVVVCRHGDDRVEIHCHGGRAAAAAIVQNLVCSGCTQLAWQEMVRSQAASAIQHEALLALADARTERCAVHLLSQYHGALDVRSAEIANLIKQHAWEAAEAALCELRATAAVGRHLASPWQIVLAGPPNVGKSSLVNALVGFERAIVLDAPGTTRDVVTTMAAFDGWLVELSDTAGLRKPEGSVEAAGVTRAWQRLSQADCVVLVFDATQPDRPQHEQLRESFPAAVRVCNKSDLSAGGAAPMSDAIMTSALLPSGMDELIAAIMARLVPVPPSPSAPLLITERQQALCEQAVAAIRRKDDRGAAAMLSALVSRAGTSAAT